jgi:DNA-binding transcriptional LysR family regulator
MGAVAAESLGARRGIGGDACTRTGADMGGRRCEGSAASMSLVAAGFGVLVVALLLAARLLAFGGVLSTRGSRRDDLRSPPHFSAKKSQISHCYFATLQHSHTITARPPCPSPNLTSPRRSASATPR